MTKGNNLGINMRSFISCGKLVTMDEEDYFKYLIYGYTIRHRSKGYYSLSFSGGSLKHKVVARILLNAPANLEVDHIDGNPLNNCRNNLRLATRSQNMANSLMPNSSGYRGVRKVGNTYQASITVNYQYISLGSFPSAALASQAYETAAKKYFGEFALQSSRKL
jgi:HNH endonuclease